MIDGQFKPYQRLQFISFGNLNVTPDLPTFVSAGATGVGITTPTGLGMPAGFTTNDFLLFSVTTAESASISTPSGWSQLSGSPLSLGTGAAGIDHYVFYKVAAGGDSVPSVTGTDNIIASILAFRGVDPVTPINVSNAVLDNATNTQCDWTGVTTTRDQCLLVFVGGTGADSGSAQFSSYSDSLTEHVDVCTSNGNGTGFCVASVGQAVAGASVAPTAALAIASLNTTYAIALNPL